MLCSCLTFTKKKQEVWLSYNVQNLFDEKLDGTEYEKFKKQSYIDHKNFSNHASVNNIFQKYDSDLKVRQIAHVLTEIRKEYGKLGVVLLQEVENVNILLTLHANTLSLQPLQMVFTKQLNQAIGLAILTRHPIKNVEQLDGSLVHKRNRPILLVTITIDNQEILIIGVHLPSRKKKSYTEMRYAMLRILSSRIKQALSCGQSVFLGGDFNEDITKISHEIFDQFDPKRPTIREQFLLINGYHHIYPEDLQKLTYPHNLETGTYFYKKKWWKLDHLLFSSHFFDQQSLDLDKVLIYRPNFLLKRTKYGPIPKAFRKGMRKESAGYSDHLPIIALIKRYTDLKT